MEVNYASNQAAADILKDMIAQGVAVQDDQGRVSIPSASKERPRGD